MDYGGLPRGDGRDETRGLEERFLITGAHGCIGAWVVRQLVNEGTEVVALDVSPDSHRLELLLDDTELARIHTAQADITDLRSLERIFDEYAVTHVVHLAALQVPFCRADPPLGARVNVVGTVNVLEAAARRGDRVSRVVYASSIAAYEEIDDAVLPGHPPMADGGVPGTVYGVYKRANEGAAAVYWRDRGLASVGLRPHTVYGPGRDQGVTSAPTVAMLAALGGVRYRIPYGGRFLFQYAPDVARAFVAASRAAPAGASVHNLPGPLVDMAQVVGAIAAEVPEAAGLIDFDDIGLPFPAEVETASFPAIIEAGPSTSLAEGVHDSLRRFRRLLDLGLVTPPPADPDAIEVRGAPDATSPA